MPGGAARLYQKLVPFLDWRHRKREAIARRLHAAFYSDFWSSPAIACGASIEDLGFGYLRLSRARASTIVNGPFVMLDDQLTFQLMGNKPVTYGLLREIDVGVPSHCTFHWRDRSKAEAFLHEAAGPIVIKPAYGTGAGRGITTDITRRSQLIKAVSAAAILCDDLLAEEQIEGRSYRLLYLDYELIDAVERGPPTVTGDGHRSIGRLIQAENERRAQARPPIALSLLACDGELATTLKEQGLSLRSVPPQGAVIAVKRVVNQNNCDENVVVTSRVHPSVREKCAQICRSLRVRLAGVDLMAPDVEHAWSKDFVVNDVNTTPGLHHHYLVSEREDENDVARTVLDRLLADLP